jgi:hypothetical protein
MSCCGDRRRDSRPLRPPAPSAPGPPAVPTDLVYSGTAELSLRGPASGRVYRVGRARRRVQVDAADAPALLGTGLFALG